MDPNNLKLREVLIVVAPLVALVLGIFFLVIGSKVLVLVILVPALLVYAYCVTKIPFKEIGKAEYEKEQKQETTALSRVWVHAKHLFSYLSILYGAILFLGLIYMAYSSFTGG